MAARFAADQGEVTARAGAQARGGAPGAVCVAARARAARRRRGARVCVCRHTAADGEGGHRKAAVALNDWLRGEVHGYGGA